MLPFLLSTQNANTSLRLCVMTQFMLRNSIVMIRMVTVTPQEMDASQWSVTKSSENPTVCNWVPTAV